MKHEKTVFMRRRVTTFTFIFILVLFSVVQGLWGKIKYFDYKNTSKFLIVVETIYLCCNYSICYFILYHVNVDSGDEAMVDLAIIRTLSVIVNGTIFIKMTYYLRLVEQFSYLIDIIFKIFDEIKSFMIVLLLISFLCSLSFYQIGQNQLMINLSRFK